MAYESWSDRIREKARDVEIVSEWVEYVIPRYLEEVEAQRMHQDGAARFLVRDLLVWRQLRKRTQDPDL